MGETHERSTSPLTSWNPGAVRDSVIDFVASVEAAAVPTAERIAVFDNDGTLWTEKPVPVQLAYLFDRWRAMAQADPARRAQHPYKAVWENDFDWLSGAITSHYRGDDTEIKVLWSAVVEESLDQDVETYTAAAQEFVTVGRHPILHRPYARCVFTPMIELVRFLEDYDFAVYIASGGDRDFMRPAAELLYGIPREKVVGSSLGLVFARGSLRYTDGPGFFDDGPEKPVRVWSRIGRRPLLVGGNADGDLPLFEFGRSDGFRLVVHHDDNEREFAYDAGCEQLLAAADERGWTIASIRDDWRSVFPLDTEQD